MVYHAKLRKKALPRSNSDQFKLTGQSIVEGRFKAVVTHINEAALVGLTDPASLIWEKLPYSFVADWILPVGDYLSASALSRAIQGTYTYTRFSRVKVDGAVYVGSDPRRFVTFGVEPWVHDDVWLDRVVTSSLEVPFPVFKGRDKIASWTHAINSIALLINAFPRFGNR
jgi:hypothetical protein